VAGPNFVTPESIAAGTDRELARIAIAWRGIIFAHLNDGSFGLVHVGLDRADNITRIISVARIPSLKMREFETAFARARAAYKETQQT
jgi:hypothetical protein